MTGAMYAAIAGLRTHMQNLNVIGNNVANINTYSYKAGRSVFQTAIYTQLTGGSNGTATAGGRNPSQIGYGASIGSVDVDMGSGNYAATGNPTDCMIDGQGFFLLGDKTMANNFAGNAEDATMLSSLTLTRVGDISFKADGYLSNYAGMTVYGFLCTGVVTKENLEQVKQEHPEKTDWEVGDPVFSDQLVPIRYPRITTSENGALQVAYPTTEGDGEGYVEGQLRDATDEDGKALPFAQFSSISIASTGVISGVCKDTGQSVVIGAIALGNVTNPNGLTMESNNYYTVGEGAGDLTITLYGGIAQEMGISRVNGSLREDEEEDAPVDLFTIRNGGAKESIISGGLEMSKTDLAQEISNMITTQRGYQANTRIITVTDSMLEELVNMKR